MTFLGENVLIRLLTGKMKTEHENRLILAGKNDLISLDREFFMKRKEIDYHLSTGNE